MSETLQSGTDEGKSTEKAPRTVRWKVTEALDLDAYVPLDMANNIRDERVRERISWVDGFGRAYADALDVERLELEEVNDDRDGDGGSEISAVSFVEDDPRAEFCSECQRYRIACTHSREIAADGGVDTTNVSGGRSFDMVSYKRRSDELASETALTPAESRVAALKEHGLSHAEIAEELDLAKSTVDEYSVRITRRIKESRRTLEELDDGSDKDDEPELVTDGGRDTAEAGVEYEDPEDSVCTEFRVETDIVDGDGDEIDAWSFKCTRCGHYTVCVDDPRDYGGRPYGCMNCSWVSLIDQESVESFAGDNDV